MINTMRNEQNEAYGTYQSENMANDAAGGPGIAENPGERDPLFEIGGQGDGRTLKDDDAETPLPGRDIARGLRTNEDGIDEIGNEIPPELRDTVDSNTESDTGGRPTGGSAARMAESDVSIRQN